MLCWLSLRTDCMQLSYMSVGLSGLKTLLVENKFFVGPVPYPYLKCSLTCISGC